MNKNVLLTAIVCLLLSFSLQAQNTVGLLSYDFSKVYDGYNLIYPHNQPTTYLLNNCGEIVHSWPDSTNYRPGNTAYIMPDGNLIKTKRPAAVAGNPIWAGGGGAIVEIRNWDNDLVWSFTQNNELARLHHDIAPLENGNILMVSWELKTEEECIQAGRDTAILTQQKLWPDYILEVDPSTDQVVWEWHAWDHLVQNFDATKDNFGVIADHPELIDINYQTNDGNPDWLHVNSIDYNEDLKQIMISVPTFSEVWVIDHTTTTEQAASHSGGQSGRGGDLMYRWGNPITYGGGTEADQTLFYQHDAQWIDNFLETTHPDYGKMAAFNNRIGTNYSTAEIFEQPWDMYLWSYTYGPNNYGPAAPSETFFHPDTFPMFSTGLSSIQILPNGNTLLSVGRFGYSFELTPQNEIVWEYKTPLLAGNPATQGDSLAINNNLTFRMNRYPSNYTAFDNRDLSGKGYLELDPNTEFCDISTNVVNPDDNYSLRIYPNPADKMVTIEWEGWMYDKIEIFDLLGRRVESFEATGGRKYLDTSDWNPGIYLLQINGADVRKLMIAR